MNRLPATVLLIVVLVMPGLTPVHAAPESTGAVSGTVTDLLTGQPVAGAAVTVCTWSLPNCGYAGGAHTDAEGHYQVGGLMFGTYRVCFSDPRYADECYDNWPVGGEGTHVVIQLDETVGGIDAALRPTGGIRGRVTDAVTGAGLADVTATALAWQGKDWAAVGSAMTGEDGRYGLPLEGGAYRVRFTLNGHIVRYYTGPDDEPVTINLGDGEAVEGIDAALSAYGRIAGQVTRGLTGEPLGGVIVHVVGRGGGSSAGGSAVTSIDGRYAVGGLLAGQYAVEFVDGEERCAPAANGGGTDVWAAPPVTVRLNETTTVDQALPEFGALSAVVVGADTGAPVEGASAVLTGPRSYYGEFKSGADGRVEAPKLTSGRYDAALSDEQGGYLGQSETITVTAGVTTTVTWQLQPIPTTPTVSRGRVTDAVTGAPLPGIKVELEDWICEGHFGCNWWPVTQTLTVADGWYEFRDPPGGGLLYFSDPAGFYVAQNVAYHGPQRGETVQYDAALTPSSLSLGRITGRVTAAGAGPILGLTVRFLHVGTGEDSSATTNWDGVYNGWLAPGVYRVHFSDLDPYAGEYYDNASTLDAAQQLTIRAGDVITANAVLEEMGRIAGRVTDAAGRPVRDARVTVLPGPDFIWDGWYSFTDADGRYLSRALPDGAYHVSVTHAEYDPQVWASSDGAVGQAVTVTAGRTTVGIDLALVHRGAVAGRVFDRQTGAPLKGIRVQACASGTSGSDGAFAVKNVQTGRCWVTFSDPNAVYPLQAYDDGSGGPYAGAVQVTSPNTTTLEMRLARRGKVTGRVTDVWGAPLTGVWVTLSQIGYPTYTTYTDLQGRYEQDYLFNVDPHYTLTFEDRGKRYAQQTQRTVVRPGEVGVVDAALDKLGEVAGHVTDAVTGEPIQYVRVEIDHNYVETDVNGYYRLMKVSLGEQTLTFTDLHRRYMALTRPITVAPNALQEGQDAALPPWGALRGRVTDAATGAPIPHAWVTLYRADGQGWARVKATITGADGTYAATNLDEGQYRVVFAHPDGWFRSKVYPNGRTLADGTDVPFKPGAETVGVDAALARRTTEIRVYLPVVIQP